MDTLDKLDAREIDAMVATKVMSITPHQHGGFLYIKEPPYSSPVDVLPYYSSDIAAAWQIVQKLQQAGNMVSVNASSESGLCWCCIYPPTGAFIETESVESAPMAICIAALKVVG